MKNIILIWFSISLLYSCNESTTTIYDAQRLTISQVRMHSGYLWFDFEYQRYQPDQKYVDSIKILFNEEYHRVYFFVKPSCACDLSQEYFPYLVKVLHKAGISDSCMIVYSMSSPKSPFAESIYLNVNSIPTIYLTKLLQPIALITDSISNELKHNPNNIVKIERIMYESLK